MKPEFIPYKGNDVHRKWVQWGWFQVVLDRASAQYAMTNDDKQRRRAKDQERRHRERAAQEARGRALGVRSINLVW